MGSDRAQLLRFTLEILQRSLPADNGSVLAGPGGVKLAAGGELSVRASGAASLWGLRATYRDIGRFSFAPLRSANGSDE